MTAQLPDRNISGKTPDSDRHTVALTFDLNRVLLYLGCLLDRVIENDGEPVAIWYGYTQYLDTVINWSLPLPSTLPFNGSILSEIDIEFFGGSIGTDLVYTAFNGLYTNTLQELQYGHQSAKQPGYSGYLIEGYWEEPMLHYHPMVIISALGSHL